MRKHLPTILLGVYTLLLSWVILLKMDFSISLFHHLRTINWIPFYDVFTSEIGNPFVDPLLNVLVFIPFGFLLSKVSSLKPYWNILIALGLSLFYEVMQYILAIGVSDVTDLITNTAGGAIGIALARLLVRIKRPKQI